MAVGGGIELEKSNPEVSVFSVSGRRTKINVAKPYAPPINRNKIAARVNAIITNATRQP